MVVSDYHAARAGKVTFDPVGMPAVVALRFTVIRSTRVPMGCLVTGQGSHAVNILIHQRDAFGLGQGDTRQGAARRFTHNPEHEAASVLMLFLPPIHTVIFDIDWADVTAQLCDNNLNMARQDLTTRDFSSHLFCKPHACFVRLMGKVG